MEPLLAAFSLTSGLLTEPTKAVLPTYHAIAFSTFEQCQVTAVINVAAVANASVLTRNHNCRLLNH